VDARSVPSYPTNLRIANPFPLLSSLPQSAISSSKDDSHLRSQLKVFFCICGEFALVCDKSLNQCPIRPIDQSHVLRVLDSVPDREGKVRKARVFKLNAKQAGQTMLKR